MLRSSTLYPLFLTVVQFIVLLTLGSVQGAFEVTTLHFSGLDIVSTALHAY